MVLMKGLFLSHLKSMMNNRNTGYVERPKWFAERGVAVVENSDEEESVSDNEIDESQNYIFPK